MVNAHGARGEEQLVTDDRMEPPSWLKGVDVSDFNISTQSTECPVSRYSPSECDRVSCFSRNSNLEDSPEASEEQLLHSLVAGEISTEIARETWDQHLRQEQHLHELVAGEISTEIAREAWDQHLRQEQHLHALVADEISTEIAREAWDQHLRQEQLLHACVAGEISTEIAREANLPVSFDEVWPPSLPVPTSQLWPGFHDFGAGLAASSSSRTQVGEPRLSRETCVSIQATPLVAQSLDDGGCPRTREESEAAIFQAMSQEVSEEIFNSFGMLRPACVTSNKAEQQELEALAKEVASDSAAFSALDR